MVADETNFFPHHQTKILFATVDCKLKSIGQWFRANKLSLNIKKDKVYIIF